MFVFVFTAPGIVQIVSDLSPEELALLVVERAGCFA
jgi:hypothetical protein